jgi:methionyl aminopeptidase
MVLCLEPMLTLSSNAGIVVLDDKWTVVTSDGLIATHAEAMIAIMDDGPLILADPRRKI